ncbi:MAG: efflux transporter outer membrane subunit [Acidithiobacillus sp.]
MNLELVSGPSMIRPTLLLVLMPLLMLAGCASQHDILSKEHTLKIVGLKLNAGIVPGNTTVHPQKAWWHVFDDPQLNHLMARALAHNPDLAIARARVAEAQGIAHIKGAKLLPNVSGSSRIQAAHWTENQFYPPPFGGSTTWNNALNLDFSYSLDLWGKYRAAHMAKKEIFAEREQEERAAVLLLENNILQNYIRYAQTEALLKQNQTLQKLQERLLYIARTRFQHGLENAEAEHRIQQSLQEIRNKNQQLTGKARLLGEELAALAGQGTVLTQPLTPPALRLETTWQAPRNVPADLVGNRPDVIARRWQVEAAAAEVHVAKTEFYPNINIVAFVGGLAAAGSFLQFLHVSSGQYGVGPSITLPIFEGGRLRGNLRTKSAEYNAAVANYNKTLITAFQQTAEAITQVNTLGARRESLRDQLEALGANREITQKRFQAGLSNQTPLLEMDAQMITLRRRQIDINAAALESLGTLYASLGGSFVPGTLPALGKPFS